MAIVVLLGVIALVFGGLYQLAQIWEPLGVIAALGLMGFLLVAH